MNFKNETFRVVQFTDLHLNSLDGTEPDACTLSLVTSCAADMRPDLMVFTGDVVSCHDSDICMGDFVHYLDEHISLPWTYCFGNHDAEQRHDYGHSHGELIEILLKSRTGLYARSEGDTEGDGRHAIGIYGPDGGLMWALYLFDNRHGSSIPGVEGDSAVTGRQIEWFNRTSEAMRTPSGEKTPALVFMHVPLREHEEVWNAGGCVGEKHEPVCCAPVNSGLYAAMLWHGNVRGVYAGHDHTNDYEGELHGGIRLGYGRASGYRGYGMKGFLRGARVFDLHAGGSMDTFIYLEDGTVFTQKVLP